MIDIKIQKNNRLYKEATTQHVNPEEQQIVPAKVYAIPRIGDFVVYATDGSDEKSKNMNFCKVIAVTHFLMSKEPSILGSG